MRWAILLATERISIDGCKAAGPHFNPFNRSQGAPGDGERQLGDLGNIFTAEGQSITPIDIIDDVLSLYDTEENIIGRTLVVHATKDDLGDGEEEASLTTGNEGGRVACGLVDQEVNAKTAIVGLSGGSNILLTQVTLICSPETNN